MAKRFLENSLQIQVAQYIKLQYKDVLFIHSPNEGNRTMKQSKSGRWYCPEGIRNKKMGVTPGCPDLLIFKTKRSENRIYCGLAIELKIKPNKPTPEQLLFIEKLKQEGWCAHIIYNFEDAKREIDSYLNYY